jgi:tetratricopeptide (TPR) repeat protein
MFRLFAAAAFLSIAAHTALAQGGNSRAPALPAQIHGQVRYARGGGPAFNILVMVEKFSGGVAAQDTTDHNGKFFFSGLTREQFIVRIHTPGFRDVQQWVELNTNLDQYLMLTLEPDGSNVAPADGNGGGLIDANVPAKAQEEFTKGCDTFKGGNHEEGILHLEKAIKILPNFLEAHLMLGAAYIETHQLEKAENTLRRALELSPKKADPHFTLGEVYRQQKKYAEAEKTLLAGLKMDDNSWRGHLVLGRVYWDMGKIAQAGPHVGRALQIKPDLAEGHLLGGDILLRARQAENALVEFEEYLRLDPNGQYVPQTRELVAKIKKALSETKK